MSSKENLLWSSVRIVVSETTRKAQPDDSASSKYTIRRSANTDSFGQCAADKLIKLFSEKGIRITSASGLASDG